MINQDKYNFWLKMELSSDNLFAFVLRRYKQKENKNSRVQSPIFQNVVKPKK